VLVQIYESDRAKPRVTSHGLARRSFASYPDDKESNTIKTLEAYSPEDRAFVEYVEHLRRQPPHLGFPRKSFMDQAIEQGVGPIDWDEIDTILQTSDDDENVVEHVAASR
jgi:hypothetical protein